MVKPRAARKKPVVLSSDSEHDDIRSPPHKRSRRGTLTSQSDRATALLNSSEAQSRRKTPPRPLKPASKKSVAEALSKAKQAYKPITSFFSNVPRTQSHQPVSSAEKASPPIEHVDEILDSSDEDQHVQSGTSLPMRQRPNVVPKVKGVNTTKGRQKFLDSGGRSSAPPVSQPMKQDPIDHRPWTEKYGPVSLDELAVHKKKAADVQTWLTDVYDGRQRKRLLLLKGPAGSGKTTTMNLLSKELGLEMHEWKNPIGTLSNSDSLMSATAQFEDFVGRTGAFGSLAFDVSAPTSKQSPVSSQSSRQKQLMLVEEYPNTFTQSSSALQSFRTSILNYLTANTFSATALFSNPTDVSQSITPIIMIISETLLSTSTAAADSFTAHRVLGLDILTHPSVSVIEFNPIAPTYMAKALNTIVVKEARKSGRRKTVGPQVIQRLSELGDIRSAVSSLEFLCVRGDDAEGWGAHVNFSKKKGLKDVALTRMEQDSLELITQRESTLGIFHSVGRVVYNKRVQQEPSPPLPQPPNWLPEKRRPKASEVNVNVLLDELGTDTQTFVAALHENYVLSCGGGDGEETIESIEGCIDAISNADLLSPDRFGASAGRRNLQGTTADNLRQDEMCFQTSVRGLLFNLPHPVKRAAPPPGIMGLKAKSQGPGGNASKGSAFVMYYPASLRLWKQQEETEGLLDVWISRAQKGELFASTTGPLKSHGTAGGVESWTRNSPFSAAPLARNPASEDTDDTWPSMLLGSSGSARDEMLLERLPYLTAILSKSHASLAAATIREIRKITSFVGTGTCRAPDEYEEDLGAREQETEQEQWSTDKPTPATPRKKKLRFEKKDVEEEEGMPALVDKGASLFLSDDDIED